MKIYELLADPNHWCQGADARDANGKEVEADSPAACAWCLLGAIQKCYPYEDDDIPGGVYDKLMVAIKRTSHEPSIGLFNDCSTHAQVLRAARAANV